MALAALGPFLLIGGAAYGQTASTVIDPVVPVGFERGRNVSVIEQFDPNYQALGVRLGGFTAFPSITGSTAVSDNVYVNNNAKVSDAFFTLSPGLRLRSGWSRHSLDIAASADAVRYAHETLRNREEYSLDAKGQLEVSYQIKVNARLQYNRLAESPYANDLAADVSVLSQYSRTVPSLGVSYTEGRTRVTGIAERYTFRFNTILFGDGSIRDQAARDKDIDRFAVQADYALSPSIAVYVQGNFEHTNYLTALGTIPENRDGDASRLIGGVALDMAALLRGKLSVGYVKRTYDAAQFRNVSGLSVESEMELFVTPLTTLTLAAQNSIQDANLGNSGAYRDSRVSFTVDHALLRNLLVTAKGIYSQRKLFEQESGETSVTSFSLNGRYQTNRTTSLGVGFSYGHGRPSGQNLGVPFDELRGQVTVQLRL